MVITHRNILANIVPIEHEMQKYRGYARPFMPLRFLNLLPLSHMFGQAMATFVPPMLSGEVMFMRSLRPRDIVQQIKSRRISVLVSVPKILDVLREHVAREFPHAAVPDPGPMHWSKRWWKYRQVHRAFGWKFWAAVVGAAPLDPGLEEYWGRLGFLVVQGYGLTETAPIVTLNHPLKTRRGSVGKPIAGVEVKIAEDGEILVRGDNVTKGYYGAPEATAEAFADGWLHTGDIGGTDEQGRIYIKGRKKEMIVTPEGLNVFPEDVERALTAIAGVRDAAVVGRTWGGEERVHAVVVPDPGVNPGVDLDAIVQRANQALGDHQKIRSASVWPGAELPRTDGTRKLKRREVKRWVDGDTTSTAAGVRRLPRRHRPRRGAALRAGPHRHRTGHDDRGAGPQLARARRAADGDRGARPDDDRRVGLRGGDDGRRSGEAGGRRRGRRSRERRSRRRSRRDRRAAPTRRRRRRAKPPKARSPSPPGTGAGRSRGCGTPACRPGSCRLAAPSPG